MLNKRTWKEFKDIGLLWWINRILHTFGWVIVYNFNDDGDIIEVYPARTKFRGFSEETETDGFIKVSQFMKDNAKELYEETKD